MNAQKRQSLRDLLACASRMRVSPGFCQRVTLKAQAIRQHRLPPTLSISAVAAAVLVLGVGTAVLLLPAKPGTTDRAAFPRELAPDQLAAPESWAEEFEGIVLMDELLAVNDPAQLDDEAFAKLLFH